MAWFPYDEVVTVPVRFTRVLYAQLAQQRFDPPRGAPAVLPKGHPEHKAADLGVKLTAGFEMLAADWARAGMPLPPPGGAQAASDTANDAAPQAAPPAPSDPGWRSYRASLERSGYFGDNLAGSKDHNAALAAAQEAYRQTDAHRRFVAAARAPAERAAGILRASPPPRAADFAPEPGPEADDAEEWLMQGEALLESALRAREEERAAHEARRAAKRSGGGGAEAAAAAADVVDVVKGVKAFLAAQGSAEGAHVPSSTADAGLRVDSSRFLRELSGALGLDWQADGDGSSGDSDASSSDDDSDDLSDDFEEGDEDDDEDVRDAAQQAAPPGDWRRYTAAEGSDSDDEAASTEDDAEHGSGDEAASFHAEYASALEAQLRDTAMRDDFARAGDGGAPTDDDAARAADGNALPPVDVDLNLVQSLLASYSAQEGLPGPASNLLGVLGLALPDNADRTSGDTRTDAT